MGNIGVYGILVVLAAFIILLVLNPKMSCFGRKIKSPFYPLTRKKKAKEAAEKKAVDYGFKLVDGAQPKPGAPAQGKDAESGKKTDDYGFKLD